VVNVHTPHVGDRQGFGLARSIRVQAARSDTNVTTRLRWTASEPSGASVDAALALDELDLLYLIILVARYALPFFVGVPSDTPSLDAC
jgi:hypothetical protein